MKNIIKNNFKEMIVYAIAEPDTGHVALNCSTIRKSIKLGKKVLFYSLEQPKDIMLKRIGIDTTNLLIEDKPLTSMKELRNSIDSFKPDLVIIDSLELLTTDKDFDASLFFRTINKFDIPFIIVLHLNPEDNKNVDFSTISREEFRTNNDEIYSLIQYSDRFMLFYKKSEKEYMVRELKNNFTDIPQWFARPSVFDIRDLLN